jgi:hypothetical protein
MGILQYVRPHCITSAPYLWAFVAGSLLIAIPYLVIPLTLLGILREVGPETPGAAEIRGVAIFVRCCGWTHLLGIAVLFAPIIDWPAVAWIFVTGGVSIASMIRLRRARSAIVAAMRSIQRLEARIA